MSIKNKVQMKKEGGRMSGDLKLEMIKIRELPADTIAQLVMASSRGPWFES